MFYLKNGKGNRVIFFISLWKICEKIVVIFDKRDFKFDKQCGSVCAYILTVGFYPWELWAGFGDRCTGTMTYAWIEPLTLVCVK